MPNGGSDCCGTCWFNMKNKGRAGHAQVTNDEPVFCAIRNFTVEAPFYTYCVNHPHHNPHKAKIPIGPVFVDEDRKILRRSPDDETIRSQLLKFVARINDIAPEEYPAGWSFDDVVVWQLGEFREIRAVRELERIAAFTPPVDDVQAPLARSREITVDLAKEALAKIRGEKSEKDERTTA